MADAFAELSAQLLRTGNAVLLDTPLDELGTALGDAEARALFLAMHESGAAHRLRDMLADGRLSRWVDDTCTAAEEETVLRQLRRWLSGGEPHGDDPARLVSLPALPDDRVGLQRWAAQHHVSAELDRDARELLGAHAGVAAGLTLLAVCAGEGERSRKSLLQSSTAGRDEARAYLLRVAAQHASTERREALWKRDAPEASLHGLVERLRALLSGTRPRSLAPLRFVSSRPVQLDVATAEARADLWGHGHEPGASVTLSLSGHEHRALEGSCSHCARTPCLHVLALAGRLLDACLDPGDRLHAALRELTRVPSWRRFVDALREPEPMPEAKGKVQFVLRVQGESVSVAVQVTKRGGTASFVSPLKLLRGPLAHDADRAVLEALSQGQRTWGAHFAPADLTVLRALVEHPRVVLDETLEPVRVTEQTLSVSFVEQPGGLLPQVSLAGRDVRRGERAAAANYLAHHDPARGLLVVAALTPLLRRLLAAMAHFRGLLPRESFAELTPLLPELRRAAQVDTPGALLGFERAPIRKLLLRITPGLDEGIDVSLTVRALPMGALFAPGQGTELVTGLVDGAPVWVRRDLAWERSTALDAMAKLELDKHARLEPYAYRIDEREPALALLSRAARLTDLLEIEWAERARKLRIAGTARASDLTIRLFKRGQWFTLEGGARVVDKDVALERLLSAARRGERYVLIEGRTYAEIEQGLFDRLAEAELCTSEVNHQLALSLSALPFLQGRWGESLLPGDAAAGAWLERLAAAGKTHVEVDARFRDVLRDYQVEGVRFLLERSAWAPGVCLADEMGLGKTVQTIALLSARSQLGPALVVAPTSLVDNWRAELERFAPELTAHVYRGKGRKELLSELGKGTLVITSYDLLLRDSEHFRGLSFATQVIDEAQMVKNARTERARAVLAIQAEFRVALSGTPIENRLADLWSMFQLIAPGLLGGWSRFRARFAVPIERYENRERAEVLRALVAPFVLRRTKSQVARELPSRTEVVHMVELSQAERDLYQAAVRHARRALGKRSRDDAMRNVQILAELTRLRQLACHPRLVLQDRRIESSKLMALVRLLEDILPRGHRALIFSQFTQHLGIVRDELEARRIPALYLDGSTPAGERARLVSRFQAQETQVFLVSLKAGGTGLNLTAADTVILLDPWWNPAAEDQAGDRAHRLGQERPVTVIKLVSQDTIEEKVLGLHEHKRRLADAVLGDGGQAVSLDADTLEALLQA